MVAELTPPAMVEELRAFLGMTEYLRQYVERYIILAAPLTDILSNPAFASQRARLSLLQWTTERHQHAFLPLKSALTSFPILAFPKWNKPFVLHTDASAAGARATLTQEFEEGERVVTFTSHSGRRRMRGGEFPPHPCSRFYVRRSDLRHPMEDEFAQVAWGAGLGLGGLSISVAPPMCTLLGRRRVVSSTGVERGEYRGRFPGGVVSDFIPEAEALDSFAPLQLDT